MSVTAFLKKCASVSRLCRNYRTCLYDFHVANGGKMVDFAEYSMPVEYTGLGIAASHKHTRTHASIFDVSHMLQSHLYGKDRFEVMERMVVGDIKELKNNQGALTLFTNEKGGIRDDLIVTNCDAGYLYIVSNAGCRMQDLQLMEETVRQAKAEGKDVSLEVLKEHALIALQGPETAAVLQKLTAIDLSSLVFMTSAETSIDGGSECRITRCGYTGEDGVEISFHQKHAESIVGSLLESKVGDVKLAGLGARDSLRLEAGLCLYGQDITKDTTPVEAGLLWTVGKRRRQLADFPGADVILKQIQEKPKRKRIGIISSAGPPPRTGMTVFSNDGTKVGEITSGCPAPTVGANIAMGYVPTSLAKNGTPLSIQVRKKRVQGQVAKMPFVPTKYFIPK